MNEAFAEQRAATAPMRRIVFVNRYFAPDVSATSQILSDLAFHLAAQGRDVHVVCGDTLYAGKQGRLPHEETIGEVRVHRVPGGRFGRSSLPGRAADYLGLYASLRNRVSALLQQGDILVVNTDPPLLSVPLAGVARRKGAIFVPWLQDLYPEVAAALGVPLVNGPLGRPLTFLRDRSLQKAHGVVVIGARMRDKLVARGLDPQRIHVIANWADDAEIVPVAREDNVLRAQWELGDKFVVGYSGNLGRAHEYATLLDAAERLRDRADIAFLFIGGGHHVERLKSAAQSRGLERLFHYQPYQDRAQLSLSLSVPDAHWLSLRPELEGLIVPSKFYGAAAAGRPIINVGATNGEVAELAMLHGCGVTVSSADGAAMAAAIERMIKSPAEAKAMGERGRRMLVEQYSRMCAMARWESFFSGLG